MKLTSLFRNARLMALSLVFGTASILAAQNNVRTEVNVTTAIELNTATDLHITAQVNAVTGSINITHPDAVIIFENVKPSKVISDYASKITINGAAWSLNQNVLASIYRHGTMVIPHGKSFKPLTVYTEENYGGESRDTYSPNTYHTSLGAFDNAIRSFKLKRGYMVTMATSKNGRGYSRVFIANDGDLEVPVLQPELSGKVSFMRIFRWQWPSKKGYSGGDGTDNELLNTTWFYTWGAGENARVDREFVPERHHETGVANNGEQKWAWPSWSEINGRDETVTHLLGQNEPDNTGVTAGEVNMSVEEIVALQEDFLTSGLRIGTPATTNPNNWIPDFVRQCKAKNLRVDYVAVHWYKGGQNPNNFINDLRWLHEQTGLPVWITEWNNGANWTSESGFPLADGTWLSWTDNLATGQANHARWMKDVLRLLDEAPFVERYAIYNAVEQKREVVTNHVLNPAGEVYAAYKADFAYNPDYAYVMKWNHIAPAGLTATYTADKNGKRATLKWTHENRELTDTTYVELENAEGSWTPIDTLFSLEDAAQEVVIELGLDAEAGMRNYRIHNVDCDGRDRYSNSASISIGGVQQAGIFQYGRLEVSNGEEIVTYFTPVDEAKSVPAVFTGLPTFHNTRMALAPQVRAIGNSQFRFYLIPWTVNYESTFAESEEIDVFVVAKGRYQVDGLELIVADFPKNIGRDTLQVTFETPFPEGVTPVVIANTQPMTASAYGTRLVVFDVTNIGFKAKVVRQKGQETLTPGFATQKASYLAITPGTGMLSHGKRISAGFGAKPTGGSSAVNMEFTDATGTALLLKNPYSLIGAQTHKYNHPSLFVKKSDLTTTIEEDGENVTLAKGYQVQRLVDKSSATNQGLASVNGDQVGWLTISDDEALVDAITAPKAQPDAPLQVTVNNRCIHILGTQPATIHAVNGQRVQAGTPLPVGLYIVTCGKQKLKVIVN